MSTRFVLFAHGSRDERWREPFEQLRARVAEDAGEGGVRLAYLDFDEPTLRQVADEAVEDGMTTLVVVPMFLAPGKHVRRDLESAVSDISDRYPLLAVDVRAAVGEDRRLWSLLAQIVAENGSSPAASSSRLSQRGSSRAEPARLDPL